MAEVRGQAQEVIAHRKKVRPEERTLQGGGLGLWMHVPASHRRGKRGGNRLTVSAEPRHVGAQSFPSLNPLHGALPRRPSPASLGPLRLCFLTEKCAHVRGAPPNPAIPARAGGSGCCTPSSARALAALLSFPPALHALCSRVSANHVPRRAAVRKQGWGEDGELALDTACCKVLEIRGGDVHRQAAEGGALGEAWTGDKNVEAVALGARNPGVQCGLSQGGARRGRGFLLQGTEGCSRAVAGPSSSRAGPWGPQDASLASGCPECRPLVVGIGTGQTTWKGSSQSWEPLLTHPFHC